MSKKASITVSFSWLFMIIIGVFFLFMAYNIIGNYQDVEEEKSQLETKQVFRNILNNVGRTTGQEEDSIRPLKNLFKDKRVEVLCEGGLPILALGDDFDAQNEYLQNYPVFMTLIEQGKTDESYIAVANYKVPFKTTNVLALVSQKNLIVLDENSQFTTLFKKKLSKESSFRELNIIEWDFNSFNNFEDVHVTGKGLNSIMFVQDSGSYTLPSLNELSFVLKVDHTEGQGGSIDFFETDGTRSTYRYLDVDESLTVPTMAMFSSPDTFECSYETLFDSIEPAYDFYIQKTQDIIDSYTDINHPNHKPDLKLCSSSLVQSEEITKYESMKLTLENTKAAIATFKNSANPNVQSDLAPVITELDNLDKALQSLEEFNCLYVY